MSPAKQLLLDAFSEIERLESAVETFRAKCDLQSEQIVRLRAEIEAMENAAYLRGGMFG